VTWTNDKLMKKEFLNHKNMQIENSIYYTFSTIAQLLAAFISLSGVFLIFKVQEFKKMQFLQVQYFYNYLNGVKGLFIGSFHDCPTIAVNLKTLHKSECLGGMDLEMENILRDPNVIASPEKKSLIKMRMTFNYIDQKRRGLIILAKTSIIIGIITIIMSLMILPLAPWINSHQSYILFILGIFGCGLSVIIMATGIFKSFEETNYLVAPDPKNWWLFDLKKNNLK
jgi:hypothetical protein